VRGEARVLGALEPKFVAPFKRIKRAR